jgi:hypothetical protein
MKCADHYIVSCYCVTYMYMLHYRWFASSDPEVAEQHLKPGDAHPQDTLERAQDIWKVTALVTFTIVTVM